MADRNTIFMFDDIDEDELGGFNDAPEFPVDSSQDDTDALDSESTQAEPGDEKASEDQPEKEPEPEPDQDKAEPKTDQQKAPKPEPEPGTQGFDVNTAIATVAKLTEQNNKLMERLDKPAEQADPQPPPEKPVFSQDQWDDDPQGCSEALFEYHDQKRAYDSQAEELERHAVAEQQQKQLKASHNESWNLSVDVMPELKDNEAARKAWTAIFNNPQAGLSNDPNGPLKATQTLRRYMAEKNLSFDQKPPAEDQSQTRSQDTAEATRRAAEDEAARQRRVRSQAMHTGGKGGKSTINLSPEQKSVCRQMNISEQAYADSLTALGGGN